MSSCSGDITADYQAPRATPPFGELNVRYRSEAPTGGDYMMEVRGFRAFPLISTGRDLTPDQRCQSDTRALTFNL